MDSAVGSVGELSQDLCGSFRKGLHPSNLPWPDAVVPIILAEFFRKCFLKMSPEVGILGIQPSTLLRGQRWQQAVTNRFQYRLAQPTHVNVIRFLWR